MQEGWCYCTTILYVRIYLHSCTTRSIDKNPVLHRMISLRAQSNKHSRSVNMHTVLIAHSGGPQAAISSSKGIQFKDTEFSTIFHQVGKLQVGGIFNQRYPFSKTFSTIFKQVSRYEIQQAYITVFTQSSHTHEVIRPRDAKRKRMPCRNCTSST